MKPVRGYQKKLRKLTKSYFEKLFQVAAFCKLLPFHPVSTATNYKSYKLFTRAHQWLLIYLMEFVLVGLTFMHVYSITSYMLDFGIDLYSTIYVIYILIYVSAALFSVTGLSYGEDAVVMLNSSRGCESPTIFNGISWDEDDFLQLFSVQLISLSGGVTFVCGIVLPVLYSSNAPWMLTARLPFLDSLPLLPRMAITFVVEYFNILLPAVSCMGNAHVFMIGFATIKMTLRRLRQRCRTHDFTKVFRWTRELELYARVCNTWWRNYFIPSQALVNFGYMLIPLYFSIISYDSHLPIYIYASYPAMGLVTLICCSIVYGQLAHIHLASVKLIQVICSFTDDGREIRKFKMRLLELDPEGPRIIKRKLEPPKHRAGRHSVCIFGLATRHKLYPLRPVRVENGDFGHYIKIGTGFKLINEVFTYVVILLRLRELGLSEIQM